MEHSDSIIYLQQNSKNRFYYLPRWVTTFRNKKPKHYVKNYRLGCGNLVSISRFLLDSSPFRSYGELWLYWQEQVSTCSYVKEGSKPSIVVYKSMDITYQRTLKDWSTSTWLSRATILSIHILLAAYSWGSLFSDELLGIPPLNTCAASSTIWSPWSGAGMKSGTSRLPCAPLLREFHGKKNSPVISSKIMNWRSTCDRQKDWMVVQNTSMMLWYASMREAQKQKTLPCMVAKSSWIRG